MSDLPPPPPEPGPDGRWARSRAWWKRRGRVEKVVVIFLVLIVVGAVGGALDDGEDGGESGRAVSGSDRNDLTAEHANAFDGCKTFVKSRLKSPGSAEFPDYFDGDGEVRVRQNGNTYTVRSHVDSENSFGALLQTSFTCEIREVGERWQLVDLQLIE